MLGSHHNRILSASTVGNLRQLACGDTNPFILRVFNVQLIFGALQPQWLLDSNLRALRDGAEGDLSPSVPPFSWQLWVYGLAI